MNEKYENKSLAELKTLPWANDEERKQIEDKIEELTKAQTSTDVTEVKEIS